MCSAGKKPAGESSSSLLSEEELNQLKEREERLARSVPQIMRDAQTAKRLQEVLEQEEVQKKEQQEAEDLALALKLARSKRKRV